jgi:hypothetical protein
MQKTQAQAGFFEAPRRASRRLCGRFLAEHKPGAQKALKQNLRLHFWGHLIKQQHFLASSGFLASSRFEKLCKQEDCPTRILRAT